MAQETKYGDIEVPGIPKDEPIFILRSQDGVSLDTIRFYAREASRQGCSTEFVEAVLVCASEFSDWQSAHPSKVKIPD